MLALAGQPTKEEKEEDQALSQLYSTKVSFSIYVTLTQSENIISSIEHHTSKLRLIIIFV